MIALLQLPLRPTTIEYTRKRYTLTTGNEYKSLNSRDRYGDRFTLLKFTIEIAIYTMKFIQFTWCLIAVFPIMIATSTVASSEIIDNNDHPHVVSNELVVAIETEEQSPRSVRRSTRSEHRFIRTSIVVYIIDLNTVDKNSLTLTFFSNSFIYFIVSETEESTNKPKPKPKPSGGSSSSSSSSGGGGGSSSSSGSGGGGSSSSSSSSGGGGSSSGGGGSGSGGSSGGSGGSSSGGGGSSGGDGSSYHSKEVVTGKHHRAGILGLAAAAMVAGAIIAFAATRRKVRT